MTIDDMPRVGDRIRLTYDKGNPNNWMRFAEVRAVVDGRLVLKRWLPVKRYHLYSILEPYEWESRREHFVVKRKRSGR